MANYQEFMQRADETALSLTRNSQNWTAFLTTAARLYKYPYNEQLMIYSQRPDATACAEFDIWNKRMGRYIKRGSKGIMVAGTKGARYVFDVSDTGTRDKSKPFKLWEYNAEHEPVIKAMLSDRHNAEGDFIFDTVKDTTRKLAAEYWRDNRRNIIGIVANSFLEGYDSYNIRVNFINAVSVSATYSVLSRCGLEPDEYFEHEDFLPIFDFNTVDTISELGTAVSGINQQILREIEITIKNYERERNAERTENYDRTDLHEERGLLHSEPDLSRNGADLRQVRDDEGGLSQEAQDRTLEQNDTSRRADAAPQRNRQDGERADRADDAGADEVGGSDGGIESDRPTQMGGLDEQLQSAGGGDYSSRTGVQLSLFPTEEEQIKIVDEAESKNELPFAFSISDTDFENLLRTGSNTDNARKRIVTEFSKNKGLESNIAFLKKIYHGGYGIKGEIDDFSAWYAEDGIHINRGSTARFSENAQIYSWVEIADKITQMLENGTFATNVEIDEYPGFERQQISETLWFLYRDLSDEARETGYLNPLKGVKPGGFPDETAYIAEKLKSMQFQSSIVTELTSLIDDSQNDKSLMRSRFHNPIELLGRIKELSLPRIAYSAYHREFPDVVPFITDDEIDENLRGGSNIEGGRGRIYDFFSAEHTQQEKTQFLKDEYGIGGSSHALSGASGSFQDHSGKGISFKKDNCTEIQMSWRNVSKRITELIRADRYFSPEAKQRYEDAKRQRVADSLYGEYLVVKEANPDNMVLFQVGDFFEMFGEDAKAAADVLEIHLAQREIKDVGKVDFCGIPAFTLEANIEKLREQFSVTISAIDSSSNERSTYSLAKLMPEVEQKTEITQDDIDAFIKNWNGNAESKRRVNEYMLQHGRERGAAAWLANEYGGENTDVLNVTYDGLSSVELPWRTVQRTLIRMTAEERFLTDADRTIKDEPLKFEEMTDEDKESFVQMIDMTRDYGEPLSDEDIALYDQIIEERTQQSEAREAPPEEAQTPEAVIEQEPIPEEPETADYSQYIGREIEIDDRRFVVDHINDLFGTVEMRDITFQSNVGFPIFRSESLEWLKHVMDLQEHSNEPVTTETVAVYPAEENNLPYDIVIERIPSDAPAPEVGNFHITDDRLGEGGAKAKFRANMDAINLLKTLEFDGRQATEEEQEILSRYVGWGSLPDAFDESKEAWADEFTELYTALSPEEYKAAKASVLNAHYTSPTVIRAMYEAIENMGFSKGNILEPSMGVGNFFGMLPESMSQSNLYGIELDSITGKIAKQLYPKADITVAGFETTDRRDFYDLAVGNVPFGQYQVSDKAYNKLGFPIHDYFIAKAIDQVRPGGVIAFVTSRYTMDKQSPEARQYFAKRAELLGVIRLPNTAFKANAGTSVVSDIIFLQKRESPIEIEPDWVHLGQNKDGYAINSYFINHPDMVLGRQTSESTQYGRQDFTVVPYEGSDLSEQLKEAVSKIGGTYREAELDDEFDEQQATDTLPADPNVKNYSYTLVDGEVYYRRNSVMVKSDVNATAIQRIKGMIELRDCVNELIDKQMDADMPDSEIKRVQGRLNTLYDNYVAKYGIINSRGNSLAFSDDSSYYLLCSLEKPDEDRQHAEKADMFTKRTIKPHKVVTSVDTASEALALSIGEKARVDMEYMSQLTGKTEQEIFQELKGVIFLNPLYSYGGNTQEKYLPADEYLSGNVREKLEVAKRSAELYPDDYNVNVEALKTAQPKDLDASEIEVRLGATWIDKEYIRQFMWETFDMPYYLRRNIEVNYSPYTAEWNITNKNSASYNDVNVYMTYGTERANAFKILEETLNLRDIRIYDTKIDADGTERRVLNSKETTLAQQKQQAIKDAFKDWIWSDASRRQELVERYNTLFNSTRPREYDGSHITFSGMNPEITLREHQLNAVAHILYGGNTLLAHEVGAGKTFEMVAAAMESKRLGLCQKALFVVPNHLTEQWASEFLRLYPSANILAATKKDFEPHNRKKFCARIATGDYDAIIIGHSQFERIPVSKERQERLIAEQIDELEQGLEELKASRAERFTIKSVERTKRSLETRLKKLQDSDRKDDVITFEQLGVDRLYVDEAHAFKNLFLYTKMRNVAGLSTSDAQKSSDMYLKCRYIDEKTDSKGVVFATGTPVSNSMTELYTMMRYLQHDTIQQKGLSHFDCWASTFGETTTAIELAPEGYTFIGR